MADTVLVLGAGAREDAIVQALRRSPQAPEVVCAPGNAGIADEVAVVPGLDPADGAAVVALARELDASLVVVGPEAPLVAGVGDALTAAGIPCAGPGREAARLEGSKAFCKEIMAAAGIAHRRRIPSSPTRPRAWRRSTATRSSSRPTDWPPARA